MTRRNIQQPRSPYEPRDVVQNDHRLQSPRKPSQGRSFADYRLSIEEGGTGQGGRQAAIDALTDVASATDNYVLQKDAATGSVIFALPAAVAATDPVITLQKAIDSDLSVRFTATPVDETQEIETFVFYLYDPTGTIVLHERTLTSVGSGSSTIRDRWATFTSAEITAAGYTPDAAETFFVDAIQTGDDADSPSIYQEL